MGKYALKSYEFEFITRTRRLLDQYARWVMPNVPAGQQYETTLLLNALLGLLVLPSEHLFDELPCDPLASWNLPANAVSWGAKTRQRDVSAFVRHARNAVAHHNIQLHDDGASITAITVTDRSGFSAHLTVDQLRAFVTQLTTHILDNHALPETHHG